MTKRKSGRIINISSVVGESGNFGQTNYAAAKAGLIGMTKSVALECAKRGVTANCIAPGFIKTPMTEAIPENIVNEKILPQIPMGVMGEPDDIAYAALFLASEEARLITGHTVDVNAGMYMR
jgi:NAD(P)-dependent dehydrogenase (short-subunit alcohol dehydrogenase family)